MNCETDYIFPVKCEKKIFNVVYEPWLLFIIGVHSEVHTRLGYNQSYTNVVNCIIIIIIQKIRLTISHIRIMSGSVC